jgi:drug/metabolite transporter (DMT)-like permease
MNKSAGNWLLFIALSVIWGSSFILMKIGLNNRMSAYDIAALRIVSAGLVLLPVALYGFRKIPRRLFPLVFLSGTLGSLIPAFLFCYAEEGMDSSLAGALNSLTPVFVILSGALIFGRRTPLYKIVGILLAFTGTLLLLGGKSDLRMANGLQYPLLVVLATLLYGINVNLVAEKLSHLPSLQVASVALSLNAVPALLVLLFSGFFKLPLHEPGLLKATLASFVLGVGGTAIATVLFYQLVKRAGGIFASMVTYGIPFVAISWGIYYRESVGWREVGCLLIILSGVYLATVKREAVSNNR